MELGLAKLVWNGEWVLYDKMCAVLDERTDERVENPHGDGLASQRIAARLRMETAPPARPGSDDREI